MASGPERRYISTRLIKYIGCYMLHYKSFELFTYKNRLQIHSYRNYICLLVGIEFLPLTKLSLESITLKPSSSGHQRIRLQMTHKCNLISLYSS